MMCFAWWKMPKGEKTDRAMKGQDKIIGKFASIEDKVAYECVITYPSELRRVYHHSHIPQKVVEALEGNGYEVKMGVPPCVLSYDSEDKLGGIMNCKASITLLSKEDGVFQHLYSSKGRDIRLTIMRVEQVWRSSHSWAGFVEEKRLVWVGTLDPESYEEPYIREKNYLVNLNFSDFSPLKRVKHQFEGLMPLDKILKACTNEITRPSLRKAQSHRPDLYTIMLDLSQYTVDTVLFGRDDDSLSLYEILNGILRAFNLTLVQREGYFLIANPMELLKNEWLYHKELVVRGADGMLLTDRVYKSVNLEMKQNLGLLTYKAKQEEVESGAGVGLVEFPKAHNDTIPSHRLYFKAVEPNNPYMLHCTLENYEDGKKENFSALYIDFRQTQGILQTQQIYPADNGFEVVRLKDGYDEYLRPVVPDTKEGATYISYPNMEKGLAKFEPAIEKKEGLFYAVYYGKNNLDYLFSNKYLDYPFSQTLKLIGSTVWKPNPYYANPLNLLTGGRIGFCTGVDDFLEGITSLASFDRVIRENIARMMKYPRTSILSLEHIKVPKGSYFSINLKLFVALGHNFVEEMPSSTRNIVTGSTASPSREFAPAYAPYPTNEVNKKVRDEYMKCRQALLSMDVYAYSSAGDKHSLRLAVDSGGEKVREEVTIIYKGYTWVENNSKNAWIHSELPFGVKSFKYNSWQSPEARNVEYTFNVSKGVLDKAEESFKSPFGDVGLILPPLPDGYDEVSVSIHDSIKLRLENANMRILLDKGFVAPNAVLVKDLELKVLGTSSVNIEDLSFEASFNDDAEEVYSEELLLSTDRRLSPISPTLLRDKQGQPVYSLEQEIAEAGHSLEELRREHIRQAYAKRSRIIEGTFEYVKYPRFLALQYVGLRYERLREEVDLRMNSSRMTLFEL